MSRISGKDLRGIMRRLPSPVTVVTTAFEGEIRGITIGSFTSASLEPALVTFNVAWESPMSDLLSRAGRFVVHFLGETQRDLSERFAVPNLTGEEQFAGVDVRTSEEGLPLLDGVRARLTCTVEAVHDAGDHALFLARVDRITEGEDGNPLVYYDRRYGTVSE